MRTTVSPELPLIVVTGGAGFIGSHTVDRLIELGYQVCVLDNLSTGKPSNLARWSDDPRLELICVDVADGLFAPLAAVTERRGRVTCVVHLAAQTAVARSIDSPLLDARVNYVGTLQVLEYARSVGVDNVVFASSAAVYGDVDELPLRESAPTRPLSPYGINKRASEMLLDYYAQVHGIASTAFRFFNVYGPRQDPHSAYSGVISRFAERARANAPLTIHGDGEQTRDFVYVSDIARAISSAVAKGGSGHAVANLGTGIETSVNRLARVIVRICESKARITHGPARAGEIIRSVADATFAQQLLAANAEEVYVVSATALADGLSETIAQMRGVSV